MANTRGNRGLAINPETPFPALFNTSSRTMAHGGGGGGGGGGRLYYDIDLVNGEKHGLTTSSPAPRIFDNPDDDVRSKVEDGRTAEIATPVI